MRRDRARPTLGRVAAVTAVLVVGLGHLPAIGRLATDSTAPVTESADTLVLSSSLRVRVVSGRSIELEVRPAPGEGYADLARRMTGKTALASTIEAQNHHVPPAPESFVRVPLPLLTDEYRALVLLDLFPQDHRDGDDWIHLARSGVVPTYDEGLWQIAEWFSSAGGRFEEIQKANGLSSPEVAVGQRIRIPAELLHAALREGPRSDDGQLEFGQDGLGSYAGYRLKAGEALYSSVVLRFTGRTSPEDVHLLAEELARRSDVRDLTDIPVNYLVKIPLDALEPEFLPPNDPRRLEADSARAEQAAELSRKPVASTRGGLNGVLVILDPGHGGRDIGTANNGIWEHDYVYDVACRVKARIEKEAAARVFLTLEDAETGCVPSTRDTLLANHQGTVRSTPPFQAVGEGESSIAVNLRWYVSNSVFRKAVGEGTDPDRVLFLSLHADSRHPSLRGLMVYVPGSRYRTSPYGHDSAAYNRFREVREAPSVQFTRAQRVRSEAVSRKLAGAIVDSFERADLPVQPYKPVRSEVIRGGRKWLPAVLRGNAVPASVLVEMLNLGNRDDAALLGTVADRERVARALVRSVYAYFGEKPPTLAESVAEAKR